MVETELFQLVFKLEDVRWGGVLGLCFKPFVGFCCDVNTLVGSKITQNFYI